MKKSVEIRQELAGLVGSQTALMEGAKKETRSLTESETTAFNDLQVKILERKSALAVAEAFEENQRSFGANGDGGESVFGKDGREGEQRSAESKGSFSLNKAIRSLLSNQPFTGAELEAHNRAKEVAREAGVGLSVSGFALPMFDSRSVKTENRADGQTVTGDSGAYGGTTVATDKGVPIDYLRPQPVVEKMGATFLTGLVGNLSFPKNNGGVTAVWKGEVETVDPTKDAWDEVELIPKRLTVRVPISLQNLMQSSFDMEVYTMKVIRTEIENKLDKAVLVGAGSGEPIGLLNAVGVNTLAVGTNGGAPTYAIQVGLETPIFTANANAAKMAYVSNSKVRGKLKTTPKESGQPIYLMSDSNDVNGYPYFNSNHIPSNLTKGTAVGVCSAEIFGDFSQVVLAQWGFMDITVDDKSRKKDGYIELIVNVFADVAVLQPTAFTVVKDLLTT